MLPSRHIAFFVYALSFFLSFSGCARFRIQELSSNLLFQIPVSLDGKKPYLPRLQKTGRVYFGLPERPLWTEKHFILADTNRHQIRFYEAGETMPALVLGKDLKEADFDDATKLMDLELGMPGPMSALPDESKLCYVVHEPRADEKAKYPVGSPAERPITSGSMIQYEPSYVQCLDEDWKKTAPLFFDGFGGKEFFFAISRLYLGEKKIYVIHKKQNHQKVWQSYLSIYEEEMEPIHLQALDIPKLKELSLRYFVETESLYPDPQSGRIYFFVSLHKKSDYSIEKKLLYVKERPEEKALLLQEDDDPADFFACPEPAGGFLLQNASEEGDQVLYKIFSSTGEYLKNVRVSLPDIRASWLETWCSPEGRIFSSRLYLGNYEIYEWK